MLAKGIASSGRTRRSLFVNAIGGWHDALRVSAATIRAKRSHRASRPQVRRSAHIDQAFLPRFFLTSTVVGDAVDAPESSPVT
jgi:hypothetical protein